MARSERCPACRGVVDLPEESDWGRIRCLDCGAKLDVRDGRLWEVDRGVREQPDEKPRRRLPRRAYDEDYDEGGRFESVRFDERQVRGKVRGAGIFTQVLGALLVVVGLLAGIGGAVGALTIDVRNDDFVVVVMAAGTAILCLPLGVAAVWAGWRMTQLRSHGAATAVVVILLVIGFLACGVFAAVFLWPMIVLMDSKVKAAFRAVEEGRMDMEW